MPDKEKKNEERKADESVQLERLKDLANLESLLEHIQDVHDNGVSLAKKLVKEGRSMFARRLLIYIFKHDLSKLGEFEYKRFFSGDKEDLKIAIEHHRLTNGHHLEHYDSYQDMPEIEIACMACDLKARSAQKGKDVKVFLKSFCEDKKISTNSKFYRSLTGFLNMLIKEKFQ